MVQEIKGFQFPFSLDPDRGSWPTQKGEGKYQQNIIEILSTQVGERVMNREFGSDLRRFVHQVNDTSMHALIKDEIIEAIHRFEPRVTITHINLQPFPKKGTLEIFLEYIINPIQKGGNLSISLTSS